MVPVDRNMLCFPGPIYHFMGRPLSLLALLLAFQIRLHHQFFFTFDFDSPQLKNESFTLLVLVMEGLFLVPLEMSTPHAASLTFGSGSHRN
jgi:hypothetical protein